MYILVKLLYHVFVLFGIFFLCACGINYVSKSVNDEDLKSISPHLCIESIVK